jgi:hypothetical protein
MIQVKKKMQRGMNFSLDTSSGIRLGPLLDAYQAVKKTGVSLENGGPVAFENLLVFIK